MPGEMTNTNNTNIMSIDLLQNWRAYLDVSERTANEYSRAVKRFLHWMQDRGITTPTRETLITYKQEMMQELKAASVQLNIIALRLFFQWAAQVNLYPNIAEHLKGVKVDNSTHKKDSLTSKNLKKIINTIDTTSMAGKRDYALFILLAVCGLRTIEAVRANIEDLRTAGEKTVLYVQGKGRTEKNDFVIVPDLVENALRSYLQERKEAKGSDPLFISVSNRSTGRMTTRSISRIIKGYMLAAGYNSDKLTAHSLRHTAVTIALMAGTPIDEVMRFARHKNIQTTMIYNHRIDQINNSCSTAIAKAIS